MTIKNFLAIKNWLNKVEQKIREKAFEEGTNPIEVEKYMPQILTKVLENKGIDSEAYFKVDKSLDKKGAKKRDLEEQEIDEESLEEEDLEENIKKESKGFIASILGGLKKNK